MGNDDLKFNDILDQCLLKFQCYLLKIANVIQAIAQKPNGTYKSIRY